VAERSLSFSSVLLLKALVSAVTLSLTVSDGTSPGRSSSYATGIGSAGGAQNRSHPDVGQSPTEREHTGESSGLSNPISVAHWLADGAGGAADTAATTSSHAVVASGLPASAHAILSSEMALAICDACGEHVSAALRCSVSSSPGAQHPVAANAGHTRFASVAFSGTAPGVVTCSSKDSNTPLLFSANATDTTQYG